MRLVGGLARRAYAAVRTPAGIVTLAVGLAVVLRAPFLHRLAFPDEAGLLIVAGNWHEGGANLYGTLFVDRPSLLLLYYQAADALGGIEAARLMGLLAVAVVVAAAGWIGHTLAGRRGTAWAALAAAALVANPMIGTRDPRPRPAVDRAQPPAQRPAPADVGGRLVPAGHVGPARYVSGYQHPQPTAPIGEAVRGGSHAWVEWWDDGWHPFDPTNDQEPGERYVVVATGRDYGDVKPLSGIYSGGATSDLVVDVHVTQLA